MGYKISDAVMADVIRYLPPDRILRNGFETNKYGEIIYIAYDRDVEIRFAGEGIIYIEYSTPPKRQKKKFDARSYIYADVADKDILDKMIDMLR